MDKAFLDTCVLFPPILRDLLLGLADRGLYAPRWSDGVAAEWLHVSARKGEMNTAAALARMDARWPDARCPEGDPALLDLPDAADRHVLAAAIAGGVSRLVTFNRRDFPRWATASRGVAVIAPDDFVMELWLSERLTVEAEVARVWPGLSGRSLRAALKKAGLPRLGKALAAG